MSETLEVVTKIAESTMPTPEKWKQVQALAQGSMMKALIGPPSAVKLHDLKGIQDISSRMRDQVFWELPLIAPAATTYQDLASTREWAVGGQINAVSKTIELINSATTYDVDTGMKYEGFEQHLRRRALDHITIGRTAFATRNPFDKEKISFEYLDPARLYFVRSKDKMGTKNRIAEPVTDEEKIWAYGFNGTATLQYQEVHLNHPIPIGSNRFISPLLLVYPTALLAWLLREHQTSSLDGRKLREIFLVETNIRDAIELGIMQLSAIYSGASVSDTGLPIIGVSTGNMTKPIMDYVGRLGLSQIPEQFDIKSFEHYYANEIAAAFGIPLRHFFNEESTTNRALEDVQEARAQQKGPQAFVRTEQRLINRSQLVRIHSPRDNPCRFLFVEETDMQSMKDRATATNLLAQGLKALSDAMGMAIEPTIIAQIAQSWELLPRDIPVEKMLTGRRVGDEARSEAIDPKKKDKDNVAVASDSGTQRSNETQGSGDSNWSNYNKAFDPESTLEYGDVLMGGDGKLLAKRWPSYALVNRMLRNGIDNEELIDSDITLRYDGANEESLDGLAATLPTEN